MRIPGTSGVTPAEALAAGARELGVPLDPERTALLCWFLEDLLRWSARMNLTALATPDEIVRVGILDSLTCLKLIPPGSRRVVDIGSGAGFPAIPLAVMLRGAEFTLVEASRKKVTFLRHIVRTLGLGQVRVWHGRAEDLAGDSGASGTYDVALARAVAPPLEQARLAAPFLRIGGLFLAQLGGAAGPDMLQEMVSLGYAPAGAIKIPGWLAGPGRQVQALRLDSHPAGR